MIRKDALRREMQQWLAEGLIEEDQARRILARYGNGLEASGGSLGARVLTACALLFIGLALLLVVSAHWDGLPRGVRFAALLALTVATNGVGVWRWGRHGEGGGWLFLGAVCYGASIMLGGQMYHLGEHFPNGVLLWMIGTLPVAFFSRRLLVTLLLVALTALWMVMETPFSPPWAGIVFLGVAGWLAWRRHSNVVMLPVLAALVLWLNLMLSWVFHTDFGPHWRAGHLTFNLALLVLAQVLCQRLELRGDSRWAPLPWLGRLSLLVLLPLTFEDLWKEYLHSHWGWLDPGLWAALPLLLAAIALKPRGILPWLALSGVLLAHGLGRPEQSLYWSVAANLVVLLVAMAWIRQGLLRADQRRFFAGLGTVAVLALLRYVDLIGDYLGAALLFLVMAGILYAGARYWRQRDPEVAHD
ncbi:MAG: DUF2157 domain-containing protein [Alloalcanivorax xenomutans]